MSDHATSGQTVLIHTQFMAPLHGLWTQDLRHVGWGRIWRRGRDILPDVMEVEVNSWSPSKQSVTWRFDSLRGG